MVVSTGQFTIIDYYDAVSLTGFISSNHPLSQVFNPDNNTFIPSYVTAPLVLTPSLFKSGSGVDIISTSAVTAIKWYDGATEIVAGTTYGYTAFVSGQNRVLTVKTNVLTGAVNSKTFTCEITYKDPGTGLDLTYKTSVTITKVSNSAGVTVPVTFAPDGIIFKNGVGTLRGTAELWRGSALDKTSLTYQWYKMDSSVTTDQGGGIGWLKLSTTVTGGGTTGWTALTLSIPAAAVDGTATFKVAIKDTDTASPTYNQIFWSTLSFIDQTDPVQVVVESSAGDVFKQGIGSTILTARLFQDGMEVDTAGTAYTYRWYKRNEAGTLVTAWGGTGIDYKTGKTLNIGSADVDVKATFVIEIS